MMVRFAAKILLVMGIVVAFTGAATPHIEILKPRQTPIAPADLCTLMSGAWCGGNIPSQHLDERIAFDPMPLTWK